MRKGHGEGLTHIPHSHNRGPTYGAEKVEEVGSIYMSLKLGTVGLHVVSRAGASW
jgi:hypothetical protein